MLRRVLRAVHPLNSMVLRYSESLCSDLTFFSSTGSEDEHSKAVRGIGYFLDDDVRALNYVDMRCYDDVL